MAVVDLPVADAGAIFVNGRDTARGREAQSPLERVLEGSESDSDTSPERRSAKRVNARTFQKMRTLELVQKLDERDKEVQQLLLAGEAAIQSNTCHGGSAPSHLDEESPMGFHWDVPDFSDVLGAVAGHCSLHAKRVVPDDLMNPVDGSPLKRTRAQYEGISQSARGLASMMAGMTQHLAQLSDPAYLDDLLALQTLEPEDAVSKQDVEEESLSEVEKLRQENQKLQEELAGCEKEKTEMSKTLQLLEHRLIMSNEYLRVAVASEDTKNRTTKMAQFGA